MAIDVAIPEMGESISEVVLIEWLKSAGEYVERDEPLCVLETDKANVELPSPDAGVLQPLKEVDETLSVGDVIARLEEGEGTAAATPVAEPIAVVTEVAESTPAPEAVAVAEETSGDEAVVLSPAARLLVEEHGLDATQIKGTGKGGRLTKGDILAYVAEREKIPAPQVVEAAATSAPVPVEAAPVVPAPPSAPAVGEGVRRVPMSRIRQRIAERLLTAQRTAAMLTTFNEIDLGAVVELRKRHKERFQEVHGVSLGFMSFFSRAVVLALREFEDVNASIEGTDIVYHDYVHLGIAVSTERGLLVPVLRHAEHMSMAQIESEIKRLALGARDNKLSLDELSGGTFTITNGGVFGSLLSTPILNPPQSGILGMHAIQQRPVAVDGEAVVRPMMYIALSYDHRLIDGKTSVTFLVRLKELLEDPARLMLEI
jgi:2-oxoglutarate dehydrogenase E2 component (dihydrolipoamide succinyltransferase)